jgi:hypothetical protein
MKQVLGRSCDIEQIRLALKRVEHETLKVLVIANQEKYPPIIVEYAKQNKTISSYKFASECQKEYCSCNTKEQSALWNYFFASINLNPADFDETPVINC